MRYEKRPDRRDVLTIQDVPTLPNGEATVVRAFDPQRVKSVLCRIDERGYLRSFREGSYLPIEWSAEPEE